MDNRLLNKAITISAKEEKLQGNKPVMKLKDEKGLTYTVYKTKQDGSTSVAWEQVQELSVGDTVQIGYVEDLGDYQGKAVTYRTIRNFNKDIGEGIKNYNQHNSPAPVQSPRTGQNLAPSGVKDDAFWEKQAYEKCCSIWAAGVIQHTGSVKQVREYLDGDAFWNLFQAIKADGEKRFNPFRQAVQRTNPGFVKEHDLPNIQQDPTADEPTFSDDELNNIPF